MVEPQDIQDPEVRGKLLEPLASLPSEGDGQHLDPDLLARYVADELPEAESRQVTEHLAVCSDGRCPDLLRDEAAGVEAVRRALYELPVESPSRLDPLPRSPRTFQCRDVLWEVFEDMASDLGCSVDYLVNEAMKEQLRARHDHSMAALKPAAAPPAPSAPMAAGARVVERPTAISSSAATSSLRSAPPRVPAGAAPPRVPAGAAPPRVPAGAAPPRAPAGAAPPRVPAGAAPPPPALGAPPPAAHRAPSPPLAPPPLTPPPLVPAPPSFGTAIRPSPAAMPPPPAAALPPSGAALPPSPPGAAVPPPGAPLGAASGPTPVPVKGSRMVPLGVTTLPMLVITCEGNRAVVGKDRFIIGRGKTASDFVVKDPNISRQHAMVEFVDGRFFIVDMGSTNGIQFEGQRVTRKPIHEGDHFQIGDHEFTFSYRG